MAKPIILEWQNQSHNIRQWCKILNLEYAMILSRYRKGCRPPELFRLKKPVKTGTPTLCWSCKNAVPDGTFGCKWSEELMPVEGWTATKTILNNFYPANSKKKYMISYCISGCPQYIQDCDIEEFKEQQFDKTE